MTLGGNSFGDSEAFGVTPTPLKKKKKRIKNKRTKSALPKKSITNKIRKNGSTVFSKSSKVAKKGGIFPKMGADFSNPTFEKDVNSIMSSNRALRTKKRRKVKNRKRS